MPVKDYIPFVFFKIAFKESRGWIFRRPDAQSFSGIDQSCHTNLIQILITRVWQKEKGEKDKYAGKTGSVRLFYAHNHYEVVLE